MTERKTSERTRETGETNERTGSEPPNPRLLFKETFEAQLDRLEQWCENIDEWQREGVDRTERAIDEFADASKETVEYVEALTADLRKNSIEALREMNEQLDPDA